MPPEPSSLRIPFRFRSSGGGGVRRGGRGGQVSVDLSPWPGGGRAREFGAGAPRRVPAAVLKPPGERPYQRGLAGARRPGDQHQPRAPRHHTCRSPLQLPQLRNPPHERPPTAPRLHDLLRERTPGRLHPTRLRERAAAGAQRTVRARVVVGRTGREVGGLGEDIGFEVAQVLPRVHAEFLAEHLPGPPQRPQRIPLPARPVQRQRQQPPAVLAQRVAGHMGLKVGDRLGRPARAQCRRGAAFHGQKAQLGQPSGLAGGPALVGELGVRGPPPQPERDVERLAGLLGGQVGGLCEQGFEAQGVHIGGVGA